MIDTVVNLDQLLAGSNFHKVGPLRPRQIHEVSGMDKSGKTHYAISAPDPILYLSIDAGTEGVVQKAEENGKIIRVAEYRRPALPPSKNTDQIKALFQPVIATIEADFRRALTLPRGTVVVDTETELWEMAQLAYHGKVASVPPLQRSVSNGWWIELVRAAQDSNVNLVLLRQQKDEWENYTENGENKSRTTGRKVAIGNEKTQFLVQARLEARRIPGGPGKPPFIPPYPQRFELEFKAVRHNSDLNGTVLVGEEINFATVAMRVAPSVPVEAWL